MTDPTADRIDEIEVFLDGGCPLCVGEIRLTRFWDRCGRIKFTDIHDASFVAANVGKSHGELMARMHGCLRDGTWVTGVEVFRRMYAAVGFGPLVWISRRPVIRHVLDIGYTIFARNRLWITARCESGMCSLRPPVAVETAQPDDR